MQHPSGLCLENSDMIDDLQDTKYIFISATNEHSTRNEQRTPRYIESDRSYLLLQEKQAQQVQQQELQQLRRDMQKEHEDFKELLRKDPGFLRGTDRPLMKSLSQMEPPRDPFLWKSFPTPSTVPACRAFELDGTELIARPLKALLDTDHIHDHVWNTSAYQTIPMLDNPNRPIIHMVEAAFVLNNLNFPNEKILAGYRAMFPLALIRDEVLLWLINEGRWKAKCLLWLPEELDIIAKAVSDGLLAAGIAFSRGLLVPAAQEMDRSAWEALRRKWAFYPKSYARVSAMCTDIQMELMNSMW
jgi:hypothetical protein